MIGRFVVCLAPVLGILTVAVGASTARAQEPDCRFYKVTADQLNMFDEPRAVSKFMAALEKNDVVCVVGDQQVADRVWAYIAYELHRHTRVSTEGWAIMSSLQPANDADLAAARASPTSPAPPAVQAMTPSEPPPSAPVAVPPPGAPPAPDTPPAADVVRFSQALTSGPVVVNGHSLEQLIAGIPTFPPIEGLPDNAWKKTCNNCHNWNQQSLCAQAQSYVKDPKMAFRISHPYGGPEKTAMMKWAEGGCQ